MRSTGRSPNSFGRPSFERSRRAAANPRCVRLLRVKPPGVRTSSVAP
ncbi:MAG TPA: hypothetical protein DCP38_09385 [Acidobacteria bacterium]|nr:hypothetical protein [Acidobacteriota bacterium]